MSSQPTIYQHNGARSLVLLHEKELRAFVDVWTRAKAANLVMPPTADPSCVSLEAMLHHTLGAAGRYMNWICEQLGLETPGINPVPPVELIAVECVSYLEHVLDKWRTPLAGVPAGKFDRQEYRSYWGVLYCIDAMLEHAVMHPIRHAYQLETLMKEAK